MAIEVSGGVTILDRADGPDRENPQTEELQQFLDAYARALVAGDVKVLSELWEVPALVVDDSGVVAVSGNEQVARFFAHAKEAYAREGIADTRPHIQRLEWPSPRIALVRVRWPYLDGGGIERGAEESTYTLRRDDRGALRVRAVVLHGTTHASIAGKH